MAGETVSIPELGRSLENEMATHSSITVQKIPWTQEPGRLQSMGSQKSQIQLIFKSWLNINTKINVNR